MEVCVEWCVDVYEEMCVEVCEEVCLAVETVAMDSIEDMLVTYRCNGVSPTRWS